MMALLMLVALALAGCSTEESLGVTSPAYGEGEQIPAEFTCDGDGTQPSYTLTNLPSGTMSIAFVMISGDPSGDGPTAPHWVQFDMPPQSEIPEDAFELGVRGRTIGALGYAPPCPRGDNIRVYTLQVFAVDSMLGLEERASMREVLAELEGRVLGLAELTGTYSRQ
jgi:hypothetical protein